jgi:hypothetical protein
LRTEPRSVATYEQTCPCEAIPGWAGPGSVIDTAGHRSPPTLSEQTLSEPVGNAKQMDLLKTDDTRLSFG